MPWIVDGHIALPFKNSFEGGIWGCEKMRGAIFLFYCSFMIMFLEIGIGGK
jgi:hypothetical protein